MKTINWSTDPDSVDTLNQPCPVGGVCVQSGMIFMRLPHPEEKVIMMAKQNDIYWVDEIPDMTEYCYIEFGEDDLKWDVIQNAKPSAAMKRSYDKAKKQLGI